jgi:hypothetical protein
MTTDDRALAIFKLLTEAEQAHAAYETAVLGGVYDQDWPAWYASYAVEHGIGEIVGHAVTADQLAAFFRIAWADFSAGAPSSSEGWGTYTARRIVAEL